MTIQIKAVKMRIHPKTFIVDLKSSYGLIEVSGVDNASFLQGQLTADINTITMTHRTLGAHCNPKGRIRSLFSIFYYENAYYLQAPLLLIPSAIAQLQKYAKFSKVQIKDVSDSWERFGIVLHSSFDPNLNSDFDSNLKSSSGYGSGSSSDSGLEIIDKLNLNQVIKLQISENNSRFEILGKREFTKPSWETLKTTLSIRSFNDWLLLDIEEGIPEIWPQTTELFLPHQLNLPELGAVSFTKGCYCGQEIIARMEYRGHLKRKMIHLTEKDSIAPPIPGTSFTHSKTAQTATVISAAKSSNNTNELLLLPDQ